MSERYNDLNWQNHMEHANIYCVGTRRNFYFKPSDMLYELVGFDFRIYVQLIFECVDTERTAIKSSAYTIVMAHIM
jgi:hypothetical protein